MNWISVEDELPKQKEDVLLVHILANDPSSIFLGYRDGVWWFETHYYCAADDANVHRSHNIPHDQITHWMPLPPNPPQDKQP